MQFVGSFVKLKKGDAFLEFLIITNIKKLSFNRQRNFKCKQGAHLKCLAKLLHTVFMVILWAALILWSFYPILCR